MQKVKIEWEEIIEEFRYLLNIYDLSFEEISQVEELKVNYNNSGYFFGYDWIYNKNYEQRIDLVCNHSKDFLIGGEIENQGTLHMVELLDKAKGNNDLIASIWICAFYEMVYKKPDDCWCGQPFMIYSEIMFKARDRIREADLWYWHHATTKQLPKLYLSETIISKIKEMDLKSILEIIVLNIKLIISDYKMVKYDSRIKND